MSVEITPLVCADLIRRSDAGEREYGEPLRTDNGRDALQDAYEEALDLACYLKQALVERGSGEKPNLAADDLALSAHPKTEEGR